MKTAGWIFFWATAAYVGMLAVMFGVVKIGMILTGAP